MKYLVDSITSWLMIGINRVFVSLLQGAQIMATDMALNQTFASNIGHVCIFNM